LGKKHSSNISVSREISLQLIHSITEKGAYANLSLEKALSASSLSVQEKKTATEIVNGTIRMIKHLDWVLNLFVQKGMEKQNPWVRSVMRMSAYQLLFMERIPDYACVNDAVEMTRKKTNQTLARVVNAVLRSIIRNQNNFEYPEDEIEYLTVYYSHPEWMIKLFLNIYGRKQTVRLLEHNNAPPHVVFRNNCLKCSRDELINSLEEDGLVCSKCSRIPWGVLIEKLNLPIADTKAYKAGCFYVQNEASMLAAAILNPAKGKLVYDLCAGVGGKTTHLAEYMHNKGQIIASDIYSKKIETLNENCRRLGIEIIDGQVKNVLDYGDNKIKADYVILDVPCSGLGVLNRRPDARWRKTPDGIKEIEELQGRMIRAAANRVAVGGYLLYATCTINSYENEYIVFDFLKENNFVLDGFKERLEFFQLDKKDNENAAQGMITILPGKYHTDGMFYALMRRTA